MTWPKMKQHIFSYQEVHGPGQLLRHFKLPQKVNRVLVFLQVGVQWAEFHILLNHDVWKEVFKKNKYDDLKMWELWFVQYSDL